MRAHTSPVDPERVDAAEPAPGVDVRTALSAGDATMVATRVAADVTTGWHHHGTERYGYVRSGTGIDDYGDAGAGVVRLRAGDFYHPPAECVHRVRSREDPLELLAASVPADGPGRDEAGASWVAVDGPEPAAEGPRVVGPDGLVSTVETPNLTRETPFPDAEHLLLMRVRAAGGADAGWHHHGENRYFGYVVDGRSETEYGARGERVAEVRAGECFSVPQGLVHRDTNPTAEEHEGVIWLYGGELWVVNVDGPPGA